MGTWGCDAFSNDDSLDWLAEIELSTGTRQLEKPISRTLMVARAVRFLPFLKNSRLFFAIFSLIAHGQKAHAAAETVAALGGRMHHDYPVLTRPWVEMNSCHYRKKMATNARVAMRFVRDFSELSVLHGMGGAPIEWLAEVDDLLNRLQELERT